MIKFTADQAIPPGYESSINIHVKKLSFWSILHTHEFHEIFLITNGTLYHYVNGHKQLLTTGTLVFIRPSDIHRYERFEGTDVGLIIVSFRNEVIQRVLDYLGDGFFSQRLLRSELPPMATLSGSEIIKVVERYERIATLPQNALMEIQASIRAFLASWLIDYFSPQYATTLPDVPDWLNQLYIDMQKKENFIKGLPYLKENSPVSYEHLCRISKKHLGKAPTEWINHFRLNYAANLLVYSKDDVTSICLEVGFNNFSHFYSLFRKEYNMSPNEYRAFQKKMVIKSDSRSLAH